MSKLNSPVRLWQLLVAVAAVGAIAVAGTAIAGGSSKSASDAAVPSKVNLGSDHGLTYKSQSDTGNGQLGGQVVKCPNKQSATGGGAFLSGPTNQTWIDASQPVDANDNDFVPDDGWQAYGHNASGSPETLTTYVICQHK